MFGAIHRTASKLVGRLVQTDGSSVWVGPLALGLWIAVLTVSSDGLLAAERAPEPPKHPRRSFDFAPPRPGEVLGNPTSGSGSPPHLAEFAPVAPTDARDAAAAQSRGDATARSSAQEPQPGSAAADPAAAPALAEDLPPTLRSLAGRISRLGVAGFLASNGDGATPAAAADAPTFERARRELAASLSRWDALYPRPARAVDAPVDAEVSPGRVIFRQAPGRMVGGMGTPF